MRCPQLLAYREWLFALLIVSSLFVVFELVIIKDDGVVRSHVISWRSSENFSVPRGTPAESTGSEGSPGSSQYATNVVQTLRTSQQNIMSRTQYVTVSESTTDSWSNRTNEGDVALTTSSRTTITNSRIHMSQEAEGLQSVGAKATNSAFNEMRTSMASAAANLSTSDGSVKDGKRVNEELRKSVAPPGQAKETEELRKSASADGQGRETEEVPESVAADGQGTETEELRESSAANGQTTEIRNDTKRIQIVIVTTKRSGSSFFGELFNANPYVFYVYEPLHLLTKDALRHLLMNSDFPRAAKSVWNHTLRCNYSTRYPQPESWLYRGGGSFDSCKSVTAIRKSSKLCPPRNISQTEIGSTVSALCRAHPYAVLKTIRVLDIAELRTFVEDPALNVHIIHLVRDPRAVMKSRWKLGERNSDLFRRKGPHADEVLDLCQHMERNIKYRFAPPAWLAGRYTLVRFEDVASDPVEQTKQIYRRLGVELHRDVISWIEKNTQGNDPREGHSVNPFSRTRNAEKVINAWKGNMSESSLRRIEGTCKRVMQELNYDTILPLT